MNGFRFFVAAIVLIAAVVVAASLRPAAKPGAEAAGNAGAPAAAEEQAEQADLGPAIRDYLLENPEVLAEAQAALEAKQEIAARAGQRQTIAASSAALFDSEHNAIFGNPEGDVTVVEFFDYNCSFCRRALADMNAILEEDPDIRFAMKEFPILGAESIAAHRVAIAFKSLKPERYEEFHAALLGSDVRADEAVAVAVARELGVDEAELRSAMESEAVQSQTDAAIREAYELAENLNITGTPSYVIGDEVVFGALGADVLREKIENVRNCGSADCS